MRSEIDVAEITFTLVKRDSIVTDFLDDKRREITDRLKERLQLGPLPPGRFVCVDSGCARREPLPQPFGELFHRFSGDTSGSAGVYWPCR